MPSTRIHEITRRQGPLHDVIIVKWNKFWNEAISRELQELDPWNLRVIAQNTSRNRGMIVFAIKSGPLGHLWRHQEALYPHWKELSTHWYYFTHSKWLFTHWEEFSLPKRRTFVPGLKTFILLCTGHDSHPGSYIGQGRVFVGLVSDIEWPSCVWYWA